MDPNEVLIQLINKGSIFNDNSLFCVEKNIDSLGLYRMSVWSRNNNLISLKGNMLKLLAVSGKQVDQSKFIINITPFNTHKRLKSQSYALNVNLANPFQTKYFYLQITLIHLTPSPLLIMVLVRPVRWRLVVYDIMGRIINTLVDDVENPGYKSITWNAKDESGKS